MIPPVIIPALFSLAGHGLSEHAEKRVWTGALRRRARAAHGMRTAKLEKANSLPPGRYWIDVFDEKKSVWDAWLATANIASDPTSFGSPSDRVQVEKTEYYEPFEDDGKSYPGRYWILFRVYQSTPWGTLMAEQIGWPNTAPASIQTSDDTVQKPDPNDARTDWLPNSPGFKLAVGGTALLAVAVLAGYAFRSFR